MLGRVTLDASVAVSASFPAEKSFEDSQRLIELLVRNQAVIVVAYPDTPRDRRRGPEIDRRPRHGQGP